MYTATLYVNAWGEVLRQVDGEGNEGRWAYDGAGQVVKEWDGYGRETGYTWNELGKLAAIRYRDGTEERYSYDHNGQVKEIRDSLGIRWSGEYDEGGRLKRERGRPGIDKQYSYDALGRITEVRNGGEVVERYTYTNRGRELVYTDGKGGSFRQNKNGYGELAEETNRLGDRQEYGYDAEGRLTETKAYSGKERRITYGDGITVTGYDDGTERTIERDLGGNIRRVTNETGTIRYEYDAGGKLTAQHDEGAGELTRYGYDRAGRRIRMESGNRDVQYGYGKNGELLWVRDNSQRLEVRYDYDVMGRETKRTYGNGVRQETYYDIGGRTVLIRERDNGNRLLRAEGYVYDEAGRRSHSVDEQGRVTKYLYDTQSRLAEVLYPWTAEKAASDRKEAEEAGLYFTVDKGTGERYNLGSGELAQLRAVLERAGTGRGNAVSGIQMVWRERYSYDGNGNRASKTTPWGTVRYEYDGENRLVRKGDVAYTHDRDGNVLSEQGLRYEAEYRYNGDNRMVYAEVTSHAEKSRSVSYYEYDGLGRRTITAGAAGAAVRTLYDGKGFEVIREGETFRDGSFTTRYAAGAATGGVTVTSRNGNNQATGERYRWISEGTEVRASADGYTTKTSLLDGAGVTLYGKGEAVAISRSIGTRSGMRYLGKDLLGSVRSVTVETGTMEDRYEYDAFGTPYQGDLANGMNLGYTGKPYDSATGLYNYGYRDYRPETARFTTTDPIRDGNNWFAYVNNDPVNWVDLWGLEKHYSEDLVDFVKQAEGFSPYLYDDANPGGGAITDLSNVRGDPTIGYGHNTRANGDTDRYLGVTLTEAQADALLRSDLDVPNRSLNNPDNVPNVDNLTQNQFDALVDRFLHEGVRNYYDDDPVEDIVYDRLSNNLPVVTNENRNDIIDAFLENATGGELNRRQNQAQLFLNGDYNGYASDPTRSNLCGD